MTEVSQLCQEGRHETYQAGLRAPQANECGGWAWHMPGERVGPECGCACHAERAMRIRLAGLTWASQGGQNSALVRQD